MPKAPSVPKELRGEAASGAPKLGTGPSPRGTLVGIGAIKVGKRPTQTKTLVGVGVVSAKPPTPSAPPREPRRSSTPYGGLTAVSPSKASSSPPGPRGPSVTTANATPPGGVVAVSRSSSSPPSATPIPVPEKAKKVAAISGSAGQSDGHGEAYAIKPTLTAERESELEATVLALLDAETSTAGTSADAQAASTKLGEEPTIVESSSEADEAEQGASATSDSAPPRDESDPVAAESTTSSSEAVDPAREPAERAVPPRESTPPPQESTLEHESKPTGVASTSLAATAVDTPATTRPRRARVWLGVAAAAGVLAVLVGIAWQQQRSMATAPAAVPAEAVVDEPAPAPRKPAGDPETKTPEKAAAAAKPPSAPSAVPSTDVAPPELSTAFSEALRPQQDENGFVAVTIRTNPPGAFIYERDRQIGRSGMTFQLKVGRRKTLLALRNNHEPTRFTIDGTQSTVDVVLPPSTRRSSGAAPVSARKAGRDSNKNADGSAAKPDRMAKPTRD